MQKQGRLFLTPSALLFQGILLNCEPKVCSLTYNHPLKKKITLHVFITISQITIPLFDIDEVCKKSGLSTGIEVTTKQQEKYLFVAFETRTKVLSTIKKQLQAICIQTSKEQKPRTLGQSLDQTSTTTITPETQWLFSTTANTILHLNNDQMTETVQSVVLNITPVQLFQHCFSDDSNEFIQLQHNAAQDKCLHVTKWQKDSKGMTRVVSFEALLTGLPMGPPSTRVRETQWYTLTKDEMVVDTIQESLDIPFGDSFTIESHWVATQTPNATTTKLVVKSGVCWKKRILLKRQVEYFSNIKTKKAHQQWLSLARKSLQGRTTEIASPATFTQNNKNDHIETESLLQQDQETDRNTPRNQRQWNPLYPNHTLTDWLLGLTLFCLIIIIFQNHTLSLQLLSQ